MLEGEDKFRARDPSGLEQLQFEYAWKWFAFHAEQRTKMFNYVILVVGALANAAVLAVNYGHLGVAAVICFVGVIFSIAYFFLDLRNRNLTWMGEEVLTAIERDIIFGQDRRFTTRNAVPVTWGLLYRQHRDQDVGTSHEGWKPKLSEITEGKHRFWLPALALTFAITFAVALIMILLRPSLVSPSSDEMSGGPSMIDVVQNWQTLIAGILAIVAAFIGGYFINGQIRASKKMERERIRRQHNAFRSVLPLALSIVIEYAENATTILRQIHGTANNGRIGPTATPPNFTGIPSEVIEVLRSTVETSEEAVASPIEELLGKIQITGARLRDLHRRMQDPSSVVIPVNVESLMVDCATIYARTGTIFLYARRASETIPAELSYKSVKEALSLMKVDDSSYPDVYAMLDRLEKAGVRAGE